MTDALGYLLDALSPEEQDSFERQLAMDPQLRAEVEAARQLLIPLASDDCIPPPPGLAERTLQRIAQAESVPLDIVRRCSREGQTRPVDFVVAAGLLFLTASLVLPAIANLQGDAARQRCAGQLQQLGVALAIYSDLENGYLPYIAAVGPMNNAGTYATQLKMRQLLSDSRQLVCPSANNAVALVPDVTQYLEMRTDPVRWTSVRRLMGGDYAYTLGFRRNNSYTGVRLSGCATQPILADRPPHNPSEGTNGNSPNHQTRGQNVLYTDGSLRWLPTRTIDGDDLFQNATRRVEAGIGPSDVVLGASEAVPDPTAEY